MSDPLAGLGVLVTRPSHQAGGLVTLIEHAGGKAFCFPAIEILDPVDNRALVTLIDRIEEFDLAVFISANAVNKALNMVHARRGRLPPGLGLACIGRQSAKELARFGYLGALVPAGGRFDSESLLALPDMQYMAGKRIVIFRGDGGREVLGNLLSDRGAVVEYAECYRRVRPQIEVASLLKSWARNEIHVVTLTSVEGLRNLHDLLGKLGQQWLAHTPAVVLSDRIREIAHELGLKAEVRVAAETSDTGLLDALKEWRKD
ncbi:MAG: uroporphyrinogen-III synthase, partial [Acidiferrobacteraceae bacterium]